MNKLTVFLALLFSSLYIHAQTRPNFGNDTEIEQWLKIKKVPTLGLGVIKNGKLSEIKVYGGAYNSIFNVASLTKPVTALIAIKLITQGKLSLDEPLYKYWIDPDISKDKSTKKLTTRLILSHQTGFKNWRWLNENKKLSFDFEPGKGYQYSGEGYEYLRRALEHKFKKPLQQLAKELLFTPLKMSDTRYTWDVNIDTNRYIKNFNADGKAYETVKTKTANAADDLLTTIEDYGNLMASIMNGNLFDANLLKTIATPQVKSVKEKHFGLGFEIYTLQNETYALAHGGSDNGVRAIVFLLPKSKDGLLIFTNSDTGDSLYEDLLKHYLGNYGQQIIDIEMK